jgi:hypothetical protein
VKYWKEKIESMTNDLNEILKEEQMEKQVQNTFKMIRRLIVIVVATFHSKF